LVLVKIKKQYPFHAPRLAHGLWGAGQMMFSKVICVFDEDVDVQNTAEVVWRMLANLDPKRDLSFVDGPIDQLDHGANQSLWGSKVCIDATRKWREEGYQRDWPEVCAMTPEVKARIDALWPQLGLGTGESPARAEARASGLPVEDWKLQLFDGLTSRARSFLAAQGNR
jgi:4-hydroxy-3-polyprenylbenzoate decarboxylase